MDKMGLINAVCSSFDGKYTKDQTLEIISRTIEVISKALEGGDNVKLKNFGVFQIVTRAARDITPPATGKPMHVPERKTVKFRISSTLKSNIT